MPFYIYPAIDIRGKKCVRLIQGDYGQETVYHHDPLEAAIHWRELGARRLHLVDLDGAREGRPVNITHIIKMAAELGIFIQCGGGIRRLEDVETYLEHGVDRVILGSSALEDPRLLRDSLEKYPGRVIVGLDLRGTRPSLHGWTEESPRDLQEILESWKETGIEELVVTDVERDGTLTGYQAVETLLKIAKMGFKVIASGGVSSIKDLYALKELTPHGVTGVVVGKALYDGRIELTEALKLEGEDAG